MITLIIVDCQNDFISGTMSRKNVRDILPNIKDFIAKHNNDIDKILFTVDWHPYNHCSFKKYGGEHPVHCVQFTPGACIEPKLLKFVQSSGIPYQVCTKGDVEEIEQTGSFKEIECVIDYLYSSYYFDSLYTADADTDFIVCGVGIQSTLENLLEGGITPKVLRKGVYSFNNGIDTFIKSKNLKEVDDRKREE